MKLCPKCNINHNKKGKFCSRKCANSRIFSEESRKKKSDANKNWWMALPEDDRHLRLQLLKENVNNAIAKTQETWRLKIQNTPWEELGFDLKRRRVFNEQRNCCNKCQLGEWLGKPITLEIEHKNGEHSDNRRENLEALCPNCHAQTDTWRGRGKKNKVSDEILLKALLESDNIHKALGCVGLSPRGKNYLRARRLLDKEIQI